jgi:hypothetical protein
VRTAVARGAWRGAFVVAVVVQLLVLYWPRAVGAGGVPGLDKVVHAAVFAAAAWTGRAAGVAGWPLAVALGAHAVVSEVLQAQVLPARTGDPVDVVADLAGIAVGMLLVAPAGQNGRRERRRSR